MARSDREVLEAHVLRAMPWHRRKLRCRQWRRKGGRPAGLRRVEVCPFEHALQVEVVDERQS